MTALVVIWILGFPAIWIAGIAMSKNSEDGSCAPFFLQIAWIIVGIIGFVVLAANNWLP